MAVESLNIKHNNFEKLKPTLPELFSDNHFNWGKLKADYEFISHISIWTVDVGEIYCICNNDLIMVPDKINQPFIEQIISSNPKKVITLDKLLANNDHLKTNKVIQMRDAEIDFKTM
jgi:hypothetical protein